MDSPFIPIKPEFDMPAQHNRMNKDKAVERAACLASELIVDHCLTRLTQTTQEGQAGGLCGATLLPSFSHLVTVLSLPSVSFLCGDADQSQLAKEDEPMVDPAPAPDKDGRRCVVGSRFRPVLYVLYSFRLFVCRFRHRPPSQ